MNDSFSLVAIGCAIAVALLVCYRLARWFSRQQALRAAERIARSFATAQAFAQASPALRDKLERYRFAKVRAALGASSALHEAATGLVSEHRMSMLEHR
jgi:hypothetical protein